MTLSVMHAFLDTIALQADSFLITFYRITGFGIIDYFIGTAILSFICILIGELSVSLAIRFNKRYLDAMSRKMTEKETLALEAYRSGDQAGYKALNKEATDAWGKHFFTMVAYSAGILWPIPFALGWMQTRFSEVQFDLAFPLSLIFGKSVGYIFTFIPIYIFCRILFKYMRPHLPYFRGVQKRLNQYDTGKSR
jgi:succinate dehydrogenase/fumarate reductase cytochrome b subunit